LILILCFVGLARGYDYVEEFGKKRFELTANALEIKYFPSYATTNESYIFELTNITQITQDSTIKTSFGSDVTLITENDPDDDNYMGLNVTKISFYLNIKQPKISQDILYELLIFNERGNVTYTNNSIINSDNNTPSPVFDWHNDMEDNKTFYYSVSPGDFLININFYQGTFITEDNIINLTLSIQSFTNIKEEENIFQLGKIVNETSVEIIPFFYYIEDESYLILEYLPFWNADIKGNNLTINFSLSPTQQDMTQIGIIIHSYSLSISKSGPSCLISVIVLILVFLI